MWKWQNEVRMIWLMTLIVIAVGAWFLEIPQFTYICAIALVMSLIQYVDAIQKQTNQIAIDRPVQLMHTSRVPLYLASIAAVVGGFLHLSWMVAFAVSVWIFFFLRWLRRLENNLNHLQTHLHRQSTVLDDQQVIGSNIHTSNNPNVIHIGPTPPKIPTQTTNETGLVDYLSQWIFKGNPVLKVAILVLVIGLILLLRFATEHWQLSLALKLAIVACVSAVIAGGGFALQAKNRSFALALEGLGLAGLFLTLFFAYYNQVIDSLLTAGVCFVVVMAITLLLSLKQQAIELALMAMLIAYLAPFTLPVRDATAIEFIAYYLVINIAVAVLSTLRPWKILNQIAFLATAVIGGIYAFVYGTINERAMMTILVIAHMAIFVWISFRFSQLIAQSDLKQFKLKPALDIALIFGAPVFAYICLYLMYFHETAWQAALSFSFALIYAALYYLAKQNQTIRLISQSYLSLMLIFFALIPPILLPEHWGVMGWAIEGALIFVFALYRQSDVSRYLAMGLLLVAGLSALYYLDQSNTLLNNMLWVLGLSYVATVLAANSHERFRQQLSFGCTAFLSILMLCASIIFIYVLNDHFQGADRFIQILLMISIVYLLLNECMLRLKATWTWLMPKWCGMIPLFIFALLIVIDLSQNGVIVWSSQFNRISFAVACLMITILWLRPLLGVRTEKEWVSLGTLLSLGLASLTLIPQMPWISIVILPLALCAWSFVQKGNTQSKPENKLSWQMFWQSYSSLLIMLIWIVCSQLFSQQAFEGYLLPILNPFDLVSLAILAGFIWVLTLQLKRGVDRGIIAVLMVLSLLWLSSYILLRALHVYFNTPYNQIELWENALIQLSLTLLWVSLAFITMSVASRKHLRSIWILGSSILAIVTLKLVLFDLSHVGTLMRVLSFLGAGGVMLIIAYIAPMPEGEKEGNAFVDKP